MEVYGEFNSLDNLDGEREILEDKELEVTDFFKKAKFSAFCGRPQIKLLRTFHFLLLFKLEGCNWVLVFLILNFSFFQFFFPFLFCLFRE